LLLDSHAIIWAVDDPGRLSAPAASALQDSSNDLLVSAATVWEVAIKVGLQKLNLSRPYRDWMMQAMTDLGATLLPITVEYAAAQAALPPLHGDPFDRLLVAQSQVGQLMLVIADPVFDRYGVTRCW
jgi:PIN domain nuclease of toxin-antitoxin system